MDFENGVPFRYESASAKIRLIEGEYVLRNIYASKRSQGHGTGLMREVEAFASKHNLRLVLEVRAYSSVTRKDILDEAQLIEFYKKFGFIIDHRKPPTWMVRPVSRELQAL